MVEQALRTMPLFHGLLQKTFREMSALFEASECGSAGMVVFAEGDPGNKLFILLSGCVNITKGGAKLSTLVADPALPRPFFGESALLDGLPRNASVTTAGPSRLLVLQSKHFTRFSLLVPDFVSRLARIKKLREKHTEILVAAENDRELAKTAGANNPLRGGSPLSKVERRNSIQMAKRAESLLGGSP